MSFLKDVNVRANLRQCDRRLWLKFWLHWAQNEFIFSGAVLPPSVSMVKLPV